MNAHTSITTQTIHNLPVAAIGAGPVGLAGLAHLVERGIDSVLLEATSRVAGNFREFGHVRLFSPWRYNVDRAARRALEQSGWTSPEPETLPTAAELVSQYLEPLAALPQIAGRLRLGSKVVLIARQRFDKVKSKGRRDSSFCDSL
jgi:cation diffusion facilitator CzcD-associated flavoprotein CzcO